MYLKMFNVSYKNKKTTKHSNKYNNNSNNNKIRIL